MFTGLKDKNGKDIYVGDIVKQITYEGEQINIVHLKDGSFMAGNLYLNNTYFNTTEIINNINKNV